jgi:hypothetical protein
MMNIKGTILGSVIAAMALIAPAGPAVADGAGVADSPKIIEGTWAVVIHPYVCTTGGFLPTTISAKHTFTAGGTMVESTAGNTFQPGQRAPGLGFWERTGQRTYRAVFEAFVLFDSPSGAQPPYKKGKQRFDQGIEMQDANHWTSDAVVTFTDSAGAVVPPSNCATVEAERMQ